MVCEFSLWILVRTTRERDIGLGHPRRRNLENLARVG